MKEDEINQYNAVKWQIKGNPPQDALDYSERLIMLYKLKNLGHVSFDKRIYNKKK